MVAAVYSRPEGLYDELVRRIGKPFKLMSYWGPLASIASSRWIAAATAEVMGMKEVAPDLLLTYLPHLDYALQRHGPSSGKAARAFADLKTLLTPLVEAARRNGYQVLVFGDYAFADATRPLYPNRLLRERGFLRTRTVAGRLYPDFHYSRAFAVADHEVAHVHVSDVSDLSDVAGLFREMGGVAEVLRGDGLAAMGIGHPRSGQVVLVAGDGAWFAYPWWERKAEAPDYAAHVDIHNKPGYDPCELFFGWPPLTVSTNAARVKGSHGRIGEGRKVAWAATFEIDPQPRSLIELASAVKAGALRGA
jgi:predicted AlkP superfamily pyrophosphatase or phosphodiesterase